MGLLTAAETVPVLLFGLAIGVWVDRRAKRPVMIVTDLGRALLLLLVPLAAWQRVLSIELLLVVALLVGLLSVFFEVASQAFLPVVLPPDELGEGNARLYMSWGLADVAGPGLAGWLTAALSAPVAIVIDAVSYLVSATLLGGIGTDEGREAGGGRREGGRTHFRQELIEGLRFVLGTPILRATATATGLANLFDGARFAVIVLFMTRTLGLDAGTVGAVLTIGALGFLVGSLYPERVARRIGLGRAILLGTLAALPGELFLITAGGPPLQAAAMVAAGQALIGLAIPTYDVNQFSLRQAVTPLRLQGRVSATMRTLIRGAFPLGALVGGLLAERIGLRGVIIAGAGGSIAAFLAIWFSPVRTLQIVPARVVEGDE
jgi:MFS family permease